jgi:hypothetical protein
MAKSSEPHHNDFAHPHDAADAILNMTRPLALTADSMAKMLRATESWQRAQQQFSQRAALLFSQAAENLRTATNPIELVSIQSSLLIRCCQDMMLIGAQLSSEMPETTGTAGEFATSAATSAASDAMKTAAPMMEAWQMIFAPLTGAHSRRH